MYVQREVGAFLLCLNCPLAESLFLDTNLPNQTLVNRCANKHKQNVTANLLLYFSSFFGLPIWLLL